MADGALKGTILGKIADSRWSVSMCVLHRPRSQSPGNNTASSSLILYTLAVPMTLSLRAHAILPKEERSSRQKPNMPWMPWTISTPPLLITSGFGSLSHGTLLYSPPNTMTISAESASLEKRARGRSDGHSLGGGPDAPSDEIPVWREEKRGEARLGCCTYIDSVNSVISA